MSRKTVSAGPLRLSLVDHEGLKTSLADVVDRYRDAERDARLQGKTIEEPNAVNVGLKLSPVFLAVLDEFAHEFRVTRSMLLRAMIQDTFERHLSIDMTGATRVEEEPALPFNEQTRVRGAA